MNLDKLAPLPLKCDSFRRSRERFVPEQSGCYVLTTFEREVIYVGLAKNLRKRFKQHLDSEEKTGVTELGRAVFFFWLETAEFNKIERTWMNIHIQHEGTLPLLNTLYAPTSV